VVGDGDWVEGVRKDIGPCVVVAGPCMNLLHD
jgi:hypothetical protein